MVKILIKKENNDIQSIFIKGHANFDKKGKDIVCASISSMLILTVNAILEFDREAIEYTEENEFKLINLKKDETTNKLLYNLVNHFKELESQYSENINIKEE